MLFAWACVPGLWTFAWSLYAIFSKRPFTEVKQRKVMVDNKDTTEEVKGTRRSTLQCSAS